MAKLLASDIEPQPLISPVNGALVDDRDHDEMLRAYQDAIDLENQLRAFKARVRDQLWASTVGGESKTRHILGR